MPRLATLLAALLLAFPASALAQGAGDNQYQDPFGNDSGQSSSGSGQGGLSDSPKVGGSGSSSSGSSGSSGSTGSSGSSGSASSGTTTTPPPHPAAAAQASGQLPRTGSDPRVLMLVGASMLLAGVGLRLRTIDPNDY